MELTKNFEPQGVENKWYKHWLDQKYFESKPDDREPFTIVIPPPNVTGVLHMGHCLNNTIQDILVRDARLKGKNACWVPGTDHASIATEAKVVAMLREKHITKSSLSREEFLKYAWEWKEKYGGIILEQLKKLGCSYDWSRTGFTMDPDYYRSVIKVFVDLYDKGLIYRGKRMVNWDPAGQTALSDEEVIFKDIDSKLYHVDYTLTDGTGKITVATTRPETILGDVAICVNPSDERYQSLIGKQVLVPIINREIPVIADDYVTADFGTGALKVTPAHDKNDNMLGLKHGLETIDTLDLQGKFTAAEITDVPLNDIIRSYEGMDRFELRKKIAEDIAAEGKLTKIEEYKGQVGTSERTGAVIENKLSLQWFIDMKKFMEKNPEVLSSVTDGEIVLHPAKAQNTYKYWIENIKDWCISRQLWWGQRIPAWYDEEGNYYVAENEAAAVQMAGGKKLSQEEDVLDTWFSSWLWPMEVFKGISNPGNEEIKYYYPTTTLVTGQDIIFFWVARMIMAGYEYEQKRPFADVYFTGMVRDKQGRKMSKQLGNSPDLLGLIDSYGADAVRFGIMIASPAGNDLLFDESSLEQGKLFNNKMWNALKLIRMWKDRQGDDGAQNDFVISWFEARLSEAARLNAQLLSQYRLSEALKNLYTLIWDDFCSWYLEWVKPDFEKNIHPQVYAKTVEFFSRIMELLHPFMPFVTEEIYHELGNSGDLAARQYSPAGDADAQILSTAEKLKQIITAFRDLRVKNNIKPKDKLQVFAEVENSNSFENIKPLLTRQANIESFLPTASADRKGINTVVGKDKFTVYSDAQIDSGAQQQALEKELQHLNGFLASVEKKLGNEKFVANARPEVIELEKKKKQDALHRIGVIQTTLAGL